MYYYTVKCNGSFATHIFLVYLIYRLFGVITHFELSVHYRKLSLRAFGFKLRDSYPDLSTETPRVVHYSFLFLQDSRAPHPTSQSINPTPYRQISEDLQEFDLQPLLDLVPRNLGKIGK